MLPRFFTSILSVLNDKIDEATENGLMFDLCGVDVFRFFTSFRMTNV